MFIWKATQSLIQTERQEEPWLDQEKLIRAQQTVTVEGKKQREEVSRMMKMHEEKRLHTCDVT